MSDQKLEELINKLFETIALYSTSSANIEECRGIIKVKTIIAFLQHLGYEVKKSRN